MAGDVKHRAGLRESFFGEEPRGGHAQDHRDLDQLQFGGRGGKGRSRPDGGETRAGFNRHPPIASAYVWQGEVHEREEVPLLVKTREELFDRIVAEVKAHHGYEVPAITSVAIPQASADYVGWIYENTSGADQEERSTRVPVK